MPSEYLGKVKPLPASFRDPSGFVYKTNDTIYRQVNALYFPDYDQLMQSGLYDKLVEKGLLIPHRELTSDRAIGHITLQPEQITQISYPYEWCFSELKDAALATLKICRIALDHNMILKDASAFNIQFHHGKILLIDTCSFARYEEGKPWEAYQQFCKHFLAPLALMSKVDIRLNSLLKIYIDGIPLDITSRLLPRRSWLSFSLLAHIHAHAKFQNKYSGGKNPERAKNKISRTGLLGILDNLEGAINKLTWRPGKTEWGNYYENTNYSANATSHKEEIVRDLATKVKPAVVWDLGGNNGYYSRIVASTGAFVVSWDIDPAAVESNYINTRQQGNTSVLPLIQDLTNPSPDIGWAHRERDALQSRGPVDMIMALALIHHLAISNNIPLKRVAEYFVELGEHLLIEFIPKEDSQVQLLLASRKDIFPEYNKDGFIEAFSYYYEVVDDRLIENSERHLFLMRKKRDHE